MNFSDIYNATCDQFGDSSASMVTRVKRYINFAQQDVASRLNWDFLMTDSFVQCTAPYETGTVTATNGSATITGSGTTFTSAMAGRKFRIDDEDDYYTILAYVSATEVTLDQNYVGTTAGSKSYSIYQDAYSLSSDMEKLINITIPNSGLQMEHIKRTEFDRLYPSPNSFDAPTTITDAGLDSSNYTKIQVYPIPDDAYILPYWYRKKLTDLSGDTDVSLIPLKYHKVLYLGAMMQAKEWDTDDQALYYSIQYENMVDAMIKDLGNGAEDRKSKARTRDIKRDFAV